MVSSNCKDHEHLHGLHLISIASGEVSTMEVRHSFVSWSQYDLRAEPLLPGLSLHKLQTAASHPANRTGRRLYSPSTAAFSHTCHSCHSSSFSSLHCIWKSPLLIFPISPIHVHGIDMCTVSHSMFLPRQLYMSCSLQ